MADIALTASKIALVDPQKAEVEPRIAAEAITKGQALYQLAAGTVGVADATTDQSKFTFYGIALDAAGAGGVVQVLTRGRVAGYTVSGVNVGVVLHLSETAGAFADAAPAGTGTAVHCGIVVALSDPGMTRAVFIGGPALL